MKWVSILTVVFANLLYWSAHAKNNDMKIKMTLNDSQIIVATLENNATSKDFVTLLPLDLQFTDYNQTEKIASLPTKLTMEGAPASVIPEVGDVAYYAPWGNLAIFYRNFGQSPGLIRLGKIDSGTENFTGDGPITVRIEILE